MRVLFMCTANSCRSILSEAMFNHIAPVGFQAVSSGSFPKGVVIPRTLDALERAGISTEGLLLRNPKEYLVDRYSERKESAEQLMARVNQRSL